VTSFISIDEKHQLNQCCYFPYVGYAPIFSEQI